MLVNILKPYYHIKVAKSGERALEVINKNHNIDLVLLDINMPGLSGFDVCTQLKSSSATEDIPVIFLTGETDAVTETKSFELGAVDFISKPINHAVVLARIKTHLGLKHANKMLHDQHNALMTEKAFVEDLIVRMREWKAFNPQDINYLVSAAEKSNGDIFMSAFRPDGSQVILVGDFTGHGLPAAVGNPIIAYIFYKMVEAGAGYQKIFTELNSAIYSMLPIGIFMAACLIETDVKRQQVKIWNAGLPDILIIKEGIIQQHLVSKSLSLGIIPDIELDTFSILSFEVGIKIYVFSDGIIEASSPDGEMFGMERLEQLLCNINDESPFSGIIEQIESFSGSSQQNDDITIIEFERK
ncbi:MAG: fused response regulator/phosphatase [Methylococcales bacterium]|nr:fused response regulator/phosphatase [Methylococcales bacterium]